MSKCVFEEVLDLVEINEVLNGIEVALVVNQSHTDYASPQREDPTCEVIVEIIVG